MLSYSLWGWRRQDVQCRSSGSLLWAIFFQQEGYQSKTTPRHADDTRVVSHEHKRMCSRVFVHFFSGMEFCDHQQTNVLQILILMFKLMNELGHVAFECFMALSKIRYFIAQSRIIMIVRRANLSKDHPTMPKAARSSPWGWSNSACCNKYYPLKQHLSEHKWLLANMHALYWNKRSC